MMQRETLKFESYKKSIKPDKDAMGWTSFWSKFSLDLEILRS